MTLRDAEESLFGGRLRILPPPEGYPITIESIFLAASVEAQIGDHVLDVGSGIGVSALCLGTRLPQIRITGLEFQRTLVRAAMENVERNKLRHRIEIFFGNLFHPPTRFAAGTFAHVMANLTRFSQDGQLDIVQNSSVSLEHWVRFCLLMVRPQGTVTFILRPFELEEVFFCTYKQLSRVFVYPLWPQGGQEAEWILVQGIRGPSKLSSSLLPGLVLSYGNGACSEEAERILHRGCPLSWKT